MGRIINLLRKLFWRSYVFIEIGVFHDVTPHRLRMLKTGLSYICDESVEGDYFEFGVARGITFICAFHLAKKLHTKINKFYAFDSFKGFPKPTGIDNAFERFKESEEAWPEELFLKNLRKKRVDIKKVRIYKGWFKETLNKDLEKKLKKNNTKIAMAWIDCDLYQSTKEVLMFIRPFVTQGTVLVFDDWLCYRGDPNKGEQRAVKEFLKKYPEIGLIPFKRFGIVGNSFIVKIKNQNDKKRDHQNM